MYYLTVTSNRKDIIYRKQFDDYASAVASTSQFYKAKADRSVLTFTTEVINGEFARSYAHLTRLEDLDGNEHLYEKRYHIAAKQSNAFSFDASFLFLIESEIGIGDAQAVISDHEQDV